MANNCIQILEENGLSKTEVRKKVLNLFLDSACALSLSDIEAAFSKIDRITLYRTLKTFENKGIIHKAVDGTHHPKYAICEPSCNEHKHEDDHAHFHCLSCGKTVCFEHVPNPAIPEVLNGYVIEEATLILSGTCTECLAQKNSRISVTETLE
jgi:Fur family ferric uptake transcriptional regulator